MTEKNGHRKIGQNIIIKCIYCSGNIRMKLQYTPFQFVLRVQYCIEVREIYNGLHMHTHDNTHDLSGSTG